MKKKQINKQNIAIVLLLIVIISFTTISVTKNSTSSPLLERWGLDNIFGFKFTITDFRSTFSEEQVVYKDTNSRCSQLYKDSETEIFINSQLSVPPESSLKSIEFPIGSTEKLESLVNLNGNCYVEYNVASAEPVTNTVYNPNSLSPCIPYVDKTVVSVRTCTPETCTSFSVLRDCSVDSPCSCLGYIDPFTGKICTGSECSTNYGKVCKVQDIREVQPNCPFLSYTHDGFETKKVSGQVFFDTEIDNYVCKISPIDIPYKCYDDICYGKNLLIKNANFCYSNINSENIYNNVFNAFGDVILDSPVVDEPVPPIIDEPIPPVIDNPTIPPVTEPPIVEENANNIKDYIINIYNKIINWFLKIF